MLNDDIDVFCQACGGCQISDGFCAVRLSLRTKSFVLSAARSGAGVVEVTGRKKLLYTQEVNGLQEFRDTVFPSFLSLEQVSLLQHDSTLPGPGKGISLNACQDNQKVKKYRGSPHEWQRYFRQSKD